jgi:hypothetical protein
MSVFTSVNWGIAGACKVRSAVLTLSAHEAWLFLSPHSYVMVPSLIPDVCRQSISLEPLSSREGVIHLSVQKHLLSTSMLVFQVGCCKLPHSHSSGK